MPEKDFCDFLEELDRRFFGAHWRQNYSNQADIKNGFKNTGKLERRYGKFQLSMYHSRFWQSFIWRPEKLEQLFDIFGSHWKDNPSLSSLNRVLDTFEHLS